MRLLLLFLFITSIFLTEIVVLGSVSLVQFPKYNENHFYATGNACSYKYMVRFDFDESDNFNPSGLTCNNPQVFFGTPNTIHSSSTYWLGNLSFTVELTQDAVVDIIWASESIGTMFFPLCATPPVKPNIIEQSQWLTYDESIYYKTLTFNFERKFYNFFYFFTFFPGICKIYDTDSYQIYIMICNMAYNEDTTITEPSIELMIENLMFDDTFFYFDFWFTNSRYRTDSLSILPYSVDSTPRIRQDFATLYRFTKPAPFVTFITSGTSNFGLVFENETQMTFANYYYVCGEFSGETSIFNENSNLNVFNGTSINVFTQPNLINASYSKEVVDAIAVGTSSESYGVYELGIQSTNLYNYTIYINYGGSIEKQVDINYPFGLVSNSEFSILVLIPKFSVYFTFYIPEFALEYNASIFTFSDSPPTLESLIFTPLSNNKMIVSSLASCPISGIYNIISQSNFDHENIIFEIRSHDIAEGDHYEGTFEKIINYPLPKNTEMWNLIANGVGTSSLSNRNAQIITNNGLGPIPLFPNFLSISEQNSLRITTLRFAMNDIDLSDIGCNNTLYVNFTTNNKNLAIYLELNSELSIINPVLYQGEWNEEFQSFSVDFPLEARDLTRSISYKVLYYNVIYNSKALPLTQQLRVKSKISDRIPPMITNLIAHGSLENVNGGEIYWTMTIQDEVNGLKSGLVKVKSNIDLLEYQIPITPTSNIYQDDYNISILIPPNCISQSFMITDIELVDTSNITSVYSLSDYDATQKPMSPFTLILDSFSEEQMIISAGCSYNNLDFNAPTIVDLIILPNDESIDVSLPENDRTVTIFFTISDEESPISTRHTPYCYLHAFFTEFISVAAVTIDNPSGTTNTTASYKCPFILPFGFGFPYSSLALSIHGYADDKLNLGGALPTYLLSKSFPSFVNITFSRSTPVITETSKINQITKDLTIYGYNFINSSVYVNNQEVPNSFKRNNIVVINYNFPITQEFNITLRNQTQISNIITINPRNNTNVPVNQVCPGTPQCGGPSNGRCINSKCICISSWVGADCLSKNIVINPPTINPSSPNTNYNATIDGENINLSSLISIVSLNEYKYDGTTLVKKYVFDKWQYTNTTSTTLTPNVEEYQYVTYITSGNQNTSVTVDVQYFKQNEVIYFANERLVMLPSTIKYKVEISKYGFQSGTNFLQLVLGASFVTDSNDVCSIQDTQSDIQSEYVKLQINSHSLYGRFVKRGVIDNRITQLPKSTVLESTNDVKTITTQIGINIPHFISNAVIDPDFSLLVDFQPAEDKSDSICTEKSKKSLSAAQIAGIVIGSVCFAAAVTTAITYTIYKKKQYSKEMKKINHKLKNMN